MRSFSARALAASGLSLARSSDPFPVGAIVPGAGAGGGAGTGGTVGVGGAVEPGAGVVPLGSTSSVIRDPPSARPSILAHPAGVAEVFHA